MANKRILAALGAVLVLAGGIAFTMRGEKAGSWNATHEGFLAIATPCCTHASLWDALDAVTPDGQRALPASAAEAAQWINEWPYRSREDYDDRQETQLSVALQNTEVRCVGPPTAGEGPPHGDDEEILNALRQRRECVYAKWKIWSGETAAERPNERHTVWADDEGFFHGRVDYWPTE